MCETLKCQPEEHTNVSSVTFSSWKIHQLLICVNVSCGIVPYKTNTNILRVATSQEYRFNTSIFLVHILRIYTWLILGTCFDWFWRRCGCGSSCHAASRWSARVACSPLHKLEIYIYSKSYKGSEGEKLKNKNHRVSSNVKYILASLRIFSSLQRLSFKPNSQKTNTIED